MIVPQGGIGWNRSFHLSANLSCLEMADDNLVLTRGCSDKTDNRKWYLVAYWLPLEFLILL